MKRQQAALIAFVLSPLAVTAGLVWMIVVSLNNPAIHKLPPVGAGAGDTGGANAIGERFAARTGGDDSQTIPAAAAAEPNMVAPESLAQGFVLIVHDKTGMASPASPIYLAGNINNWNPADPNFKLSAQSDMRWRITLPKPAAETLAFKFTRGDWSLEELDDNLAVIPNRSLPKVDASKLAPGEQPKIELVVPHWGDELPDRKGSAPGTFRSLNVTGTVRRIQVQGGAGTATGLTRDLLVWLPPGYDDQANHDRRYPVLYLHDGQNIFEKHGGIPAEWGADETATGLIERSEMEPIIIVAIPHSGAGRNSEYMPINAINGLTPDGERHVQWLLSEVMPRVERSFRTKAGPDNTAVGGSSLGAVISLYAAATNPGTFGLVLAESLPLRTGSAPAWDPFIDGVKTWPRRIYLGVGGKETGNDPQREQNNLQYLQAVQRLDKKLEQAGLGADRRLLIVDQDAVHNEAAWATRLPRALTFLFPPAPAAK